MAERTLSAEDIAAGVRKLADSIRERTADKSVALVGIRSRGDEVAERVLNLLSEEDGDLAFGTLDISLYRDDFEHLHENPALQGSDINFTVEGAHVINTDVWLSMGQEDQKDKEAEFAGFQVNADLLSTAAEGHIVLHCLPAYREKEISDEVLEKHADTIFQQAENRLHAQKAILLALASK